VDDPSDSRYLVVVGLGADGWASVTPPVRAVVESAEVLVGSRRLLDAVPVLADQERIAWPTPFSVEVLDAHPEAVVLATGDPLVSGVATTLIERYGDDAVTVVPAVSSVAVARARMGWTDPTVLRDPRELPRHLAPGHRVLLLSPDETIPARVAATLVEAGYGATTMTALSDLDTEHERHATASADAGGPEASRLHVLALELRGTAVSSWAGGLPDDAFEHDGQLTKRDLRASALARLAPYPGALLWDVGAGAGSVGIEWSRAHVACRAVAVERDPERAARIARNAERLGVPRLRVVEGAAPDVLAGLERPDAVFVGGGATAPGLLDTCRDRLAPGGRLVVHAVTLETERVVLDLHAAHGGELTRHAVETAAPIGTFTGWTPARAVVQWAWVKP
jgi:precorrin-6Y C5,15-methyltransferase (decarboxylating)